MLYLAKLLCRWQMGGPSESCPEKKFSLKIEKKKFENRINFKK
jgi:hypothetical protein